MSKKEPKFTNAEGGLRAPALPIDLRNVTKTYGKMTALDNVSLEIGAGEFLSLLGPSGSGKTTLLMVIAGFIRPDHGALVVGGRDMVVQPPHKRDLGMVFQNYALFPNMSVAGNVGYPLRLRRVPAREAAERTEKALEMVQLGGYGGRSIDALSGGQRQRVALARAIVFEPRILLMDEPLSALDKQLREQMQIEIRRIHDQLGITTIYVTHDQREALTMSDRIAVIDHGRFMQVDTPRALYDQPLNRFVASFIGESNFLPATLSSGKPYFGDMPLRVTRPVPEGASHQLMIRPEKLRIVQDGAPEGDFHNRFPATTRQVVFQGDSALVYAILADGSEVSMRLPSRAGSGTALPEPGQSMTLGLHEDDTVLVAE